MQKIQIRPLTTLDELAEVETIQNAVWTDATGHYSRYQLLPLIRNGGMVIGAFDGDRMIGFVMGYLGVESLDSERPAMANLKLASQRMGILPDYRDKGVGYDLKLAQRQYAVQRGIRLITWTFDPLLSRNAYLNVHKLGAIVRDYWRDYYGTTSSSHVLLGSSDRVIVEWWVTNNRVEQRIQGKRAGLTIEQYTHANALILNPTSVGPRGYPQPCEMVAQSGGLVVLLEIPTDFRAIAAADPDLARAWRYHIRGLMEQAFASGYTVTDFLHGQYESRERSFYALTYAEQNASSFSSN